MAEKKQMHPETNKSNKTSGTEGRKGPAPEGQEDVSSSSERQEEAILGHLDQIGSIMTKGLDLVEASITLGINLANKFGSVVQEQTIDKIDRAGGPYAGQGETPYIESGMGDASYYQNEEDRLGEIETPPNVNYVINRLPLFPGSPVKISFTINNDSVSFPKKLRMRVEGFVGEMHGANLNGKDFSIKPGTKVIAPMDFDKFTLTGTIPQDVLSDTYCGWIFVSEAEELKIPVRLTVTAQS